MLITFAVLSDQFCMLSKFFAIALPNCLASSVIVPDEYIWRNRSSSWFANRQEDSSSGNCPYLGESSYSSDSLATLVSDPLRYSQSTKLMAIFGSLGGVNWRRNDNWGQGDPCFQNWYGLICDCDANVIGIQLVDNGLVGTIPNELGQLTHLTEIYLQSTQRYSTGYSNPFMNRIAGSVPSLTNLLELTVLDISFNEIEFLPADIGSNLNLEVLSAAGNKLTSLPSNLGLLTRLRILELNDNLISSIFPTSEICSLGNIYVLNLGNNSLSGTLYDTCLRGLDPLVFDVAGPHPTTIGSYSLLNGSLPKSLVDTWNNINQGYMSVYQQFGMSGDIPEACIDLRFCYTANFLSHGNLAWITGNPGDVPQVVYDTIALATQ